MIDGYVHAANERRKSEKVDKLAATDPLRLAIIARRVGLGLSRRAAAVAIGISPNTLACIEQQRYAPSTFVQRILTRWLEGRATP